jgi:hypothetical protein
MDWLDRQLAAVAPRGHAGLSDGTVGTLLYLHLRRQPSPRAMWARVVAPLLLAAAARG